MITAVIDAGQHYCQAVSDLWQWDYGQTLRIQGVKLPAAVEVQFSTTERIGETVTRIGVTQEGVTEVPIPDTLLEGGGTTQDYTIYAFVYIENGDSGKTEYRVSMKVRARPKPEAHATPEEGELFRQAIVAVAESADRAESARKSAEASADEAKTAKENAETAVKNAEAFKTEAETARSGAVRAATESTDAKNSAEKSRAAAEKAKQDAEAAKAAAEKLAKKVETAKEEIQESADQIQKNAIEIDSLKEDIDTTEVMSNSIEFNVKNINFINGYVLRDTGKTESASTFYTTNFIPTPLVDKLIISIDGPAIVRFAQYDASKNFIDGTYINKSDTTQFINVVFSDSTRYMKICVGNWTDLKPIEYYKSIVSVLGNTILGEVKKVSDSISKYKKAQYIKKDVAYSYLPLKIKTGVDVPSGTFEKKFFKASTFFEYYNDMISISVAPNLLFMVSVNSDGYGSEATTVATWRSEDFELADFSYKYIFLQVKKQDGSEITFADIENSVQIKRYTSIDAYVGKSEHIISANNIKNAPVVSKLVDESYAHESNFVIINGMCYMHYMYNTWDKWSDMNIHPETQGYIGVRLSVFSIAEPDKRTVYDIVRGGDDFLGETVGTAFCGSGTIAKIGNNIRILTNITLSNSGRTCVYFDFDSTTNSITKKGICNVKIKGTDDLIPMTTQNGKQHAKWLYSNGYVDTEYESLFDEFGSDVREYSDNGTKYVTTAMANGTNVRSCVLLISEDCINWTALGILDTQTADGARLNVMEAGAFRFGSQFYLIGRNNVNIATDSKDVPYFWKIEDSNLYKSTKPVCLDGDVDCSGAKPSVIRLISRNNLFLLANISAYDKNEFSLVSGISRVALEFYKLNFDKDTMKANRILRVSMREGIHTPCLYEYEGNVYMSYTSQKRLLHFIDGDIRFCKLDEELFH